MGTPEKGCPKRKQEDKHEPRESQVGRAGGLDAPLTSPDAYYKHHTRLVYYSCDPTTEGKTSAILEGYRLSLARNIAPSARTQSQVDSWKDMGSDCCWHRGPTANGVSHENRVRKARKHCGDEKAQG